MSAAPQPDLIFDVGAHRGEDSAFYLKAGYRVVAVEANPQVAAALRERFADEIEQGRYTLIEQAIAARKGTVRFFINDTVSDWGTADPDWAARNARFGAPSRPIDVAADRFSTMLEAHGCPHYCKIDVEGADHLCLQAMGETAFRPRYLSIETSGRSWRELKAEFALLQALGYTRFKIADQSRHPRGPFTGKDGRRFEHEMPMGASGPFGEDVPGEWLTARQAIGRYRRIYVVYALYGNRALLRRVVMALPLLRRLERLVTWHDTHARHGTAGE